MGKSDLGLRIDEEKLAAVREAQCEEVWVADEIFDDQMLDEAWKHYYSIRRYDKNGKLLWRSFAIWSWGVDEYGEWDDEFGVAEWWWLSLSEDERRFVMGEIYHKADIVGLVEMYRAVKS